MATPRILVFSRKPEDGHSIVRLLAPEGYQIGWSDNGPETICQALSGLLDAVIVFLQRRRHQELEYVSCLNRSDQRLPIVVISEHDSLPLQRKVRKYRIFYYLTQPVEPEELKAVLRDAVATSGRRR